MNGDTLLSLANNSQKPLVIKAANKVRNIIANAKDHTPYEYECACCELADAINDKETN